MYKFILYKQNINTFLETSSRSNVNIQKHRKEFVSIYKKYINALCIDKIKTFFVLITFCMHLVRLLLLYN